MIDPVQVFLELNALKPSAYAANSRYKGVGTLTFQTGNGETVVYSIRRFIAQPEQFALVQENSVVEGDRVDNLANTYLGAPEQYWRLCDANVVMNPTELTDTVGRRIRITMPEGFPAPIYA